MNWWLKMMRKYNKEKAIVYNTLQLYRHDRSFRLPAKALHEEARVYGFKIGVKNSKRCLYGERRTNGLKRKRIPNTNLQR